MSPSRGILFKAEMIRALLNTQPDVWPAVAIDPAKPWKWQTRRLIDPQPAKRLEFAQCYRDGTTEFGVSIDAPNLEIRRARYAQGRILYACETFCAGGAFGADGRVQWRADYLDGKNPSALPWKPAIHMPRAISRLWFEVMQVRVERVDHISEADAKAEGVLTSDAFLGVEGPDVRLPPVPMTYKQAYWGLWDYINGEGSFKQGPWVWAYDLKRINRPNP